MNDIFIIYQKKDREQVEYIANALKKRELSVWWERSLYPGKTYREYINELMKSKIVLVIWSETSIFSRWIKIVTNKALKKLERQKVISVLVADLKPPALDRPLIKYKPKLIDWIGDPNHTEYTRLLLLISDRFPDKKSRLLEGLSAEIINKNKKAINRRKLMSFENIRLPSPHKSLYSSEGWGAGTGLRPFIKKQDIADISVFAPKQVIPNSKFILEIWAYIKDNRNQVKDLVGELGRGKMVGISSGASLNRRSILAIQLKIPSFNIFDLNATLNWDGNFSNASFMIEVPKQIDAGEYLGQALISCYGMNTITLNFNIYVTHNENKEYENKTDYAKIPETAFISYSRKDSAEVSMRLQGMEIVLKSFKPFYDIKSIERGEDWQKTIEDNVPYKDVFYLFWSRNAANSKWVDKEWRLAYKMRNLNYIDPVPIESPAIAPPPKELERLNFEDKYLAYIAYAQSIKDHDQI